MCGLFSTNGKIFREEIKLLLWDTAGQERFNVIISSYTRGCLGFVIGHDVTDRSSLETIRDKNMSYWKDCPYATVMAIENKLDLGEIREVSIEEDEALARDIHTFIFFEGKYKLIPTVLSTSNALILIFF